MNPAPVRSLVPASAAPARTPLPGVGEAEATARPARAVRLHRWFSEDARDTDRVSWLRQEWLAAHRSVVVAAYTATGDRRAGSLFDLAA